MPRSLVKKQSIVTWVYNLSAVKADTALWIQIPMTVDSASTILSKLRIGNLKGQGLGRA